MSERTDMRNEGTSETKSQNGLVRKALDLTLGIVQAISLGIIGWMAINIVQLKSDVAVLYVGRDTNRENIEQFRVMANALGDIKSDIAVIQGNRFTSADALAVWTKIAEIQQQVAKMPTESPPLWFVGRIDKLESTVDGRLKRVEDSLVEHTKQAGGKP